MISLVQHLPVGNAVRLLLRPPPGATDWRVLRKDADAFSGADDPAAVLVYAGDDPTVLDVSVVNGVSVFYRAYYRVAGVWQESASASALPQATFTDLSADPQTLVRNRLDLGLQVYVARGELTHDMGHIPVLTSSPAAEDIVFPVVTVRLMADSSDERFVGDVVARDVFDADAFDWHSADGCLDRVQLQIVGWSLNADERALLRRAMRAVLLGNVPVFDAAGLAQVDWQFVDSEDFESYDAPVWQSVCTLSCLAPVLVDGTDPAIRDVVITQK